MVKGSGGGGKSGRTGGGGGGSLTDRMQSGAATYEEVSSFISSKFDNKISALESQREKLRSEAKIIEMTPTQPGKYSTGQPVRNAAMERRSKNIDKQLEKISNKISKAKVDKIPYDKYLRKF